VRRNLEAASASLAALKAAAHCGDHSTIDVPWDASLRVSVNGFRRAAAVGMNRR
jgi:hypothetical protein